MSHHLFGHTKSGEAVHRIGLANGKLSASVMTWGAVLLELNFHDYGRSLVLGFDRFAPYQDHSPYFGAIVGRFANRIGGAGFELDGERHETDRNALGRNTLHGGSKGISHRVWSIVRQTPASVTLQLTDPEGEMGFPGTCQHTCRYQLLDDDTMEIGLECRTDAPTIAGMAHHSYFNLDGSNDCRGHLLQIEADSYLPVDADLIPTGSIESVSNTAFDFTSLRPIGTTRDYDHNFSLSQSRRNLLPCARLESPSRELILEMRTTEPGLQLYTGAGIKTPQHGAHQGLCLETQNWPDAPNKPHFPSAVLRPGEVLRQTTRYRFSTGRRDRLTR